MLYSIPSRGQTSGEPRSAPLTAKRTTAAEGHRLFAVLFSDSDDKGMIFIVKSGVHRQVVHEKTLQGVVIHITRNQPLPAEYPPGIGINHKEWLFSCIE